jgi:hypothetical protein
VLFDLVREELRRGPAAKPQSEGERVGNQSGGEVNNSRPVPGE